MASLLICLRVPRAETRQLLWQPHVNGILKLASGKECQFCKPRELSGKARLSTARKLRQSSDDLVLDKEPEMHVPKTMPLIPQTMYSAEALSGSQNTDLRPVQRGPLTVMDGPAPERDRSKDPRLPRSVQAVYLRPLKRRATYGYPACDLQLRSYSVRNVEFFADFALRTAYYLKIPAAGPIPLPRITERWTVPRSSFIFKKSQENFERITLRRLIQIQDAHPESVELWLAFLRKHAYHGIGMKANVWQHEKLGVGKTMDVSLENLRQSLEPKWSHFGRRKTLETSERAYEMMRDEAFHQTVDAPIQ